MPYRKYIADASGCPNGVQYVDNVVPNILVAASDASVDFKNLADYVCDGTADEVQINAAIAALPSLGGKVVLSEGTFTIAAAIDCVAKQGIHLQGQGMLSTRITTASTTIDMLILSNGGTRINYFSVSDMRIDGTGYTRTAGACIRSNIAGYVRLENVEIDSAFYGIQIYESVYCWINNCIITDTAANGIGLLIDAATGSPTHRSNEVWLNNVYINDFNTKSLATLALTNADGFRAINCNFCGSTYGAILSADGGKDVVCCNFENCNFENNDYGVSIAGDTGDMCQHISFISCWMSYNAYNGIVINGAQAPRNIKIQNCSVLVNNTDGIYLDTGVDVLIAGCTISGNSNGSSGTDAGILIGNATSNWQIIGNRIGQVADLANSQKYAIEIEVGAGDHYIIKDNDLQTNTTGPILNGATGTDKVIRSNIGYLTENSGTATVTAAATTVVVNHGLAATPTRVLVSATLWSAATKAWVTTIGATQFTINVDQVPGAGTATFDWRAQIGEG